MTRPFDLFAVMRGFRILSSDYDRLKTEPSEKAAEDFIDDLAALAEAAGYELKPVKVRAPEVMEGAE